MVHVWDVRRGWFALISVWLSHELHTEVLPGSPLVALKGHGAPISSIAISPDDHTIASGDDGTKVL